MSDEDRIEGLLHSGHYVFIVCQPAPHDELLARLGLAPFLESLADPNRGEIYCGHDGRWAHILDSLSYPLWFSTTFAHHVAELARSHDVYRVSLNDADEGYHFSYHRGGRLVREVVVGSSNWIEVEVQRDYGSPLDEEYGLGPIVGAYDVRTKLLRIGGSLGIELDHRRLDMRSYGPTALVSAK